MEVIKIIGVGLISLIIIIMLKLYINVIKKASNYIISKHKYKEADLFKSASKLLLCVCVMI